MADGRRLKIRCVEGLDLPIWPFFAFYSTNMKSLSDVLVATLEVFPDVSPREMRAMRYMKSRVYSDAIAPVFISLGKEVSDRMYQRGEPQVFIAEQVYGGRDAADQPT